MKLIDANVILRYLLKDNQEQFEKAKEVIQEGAMTTTEVIAEVIYVLTKVYGVSREDASWLLHCLLLDIKADNCSALQYAAGLFNQTTLDFVDCLLIAYRKTFHVDVFSFDKNSTPDWKTVYDIQL